MVTDGRDGEPMPFLLAVRPRRGWGVGSRAAPHVPMAFSFASTLLTLVGLFALLPALSGGCGSDRCGVSVGLGSVGLHLAALLATLALRFPRRRGVGIGMWLASALAFTGFTVEGVLDAAWERDGGSLLPALVSGAGSLSLGVLGLTCVGGPPATLRRAVFGSGALVTIVIAATLYGGLAFSIRGGSGDPRTPARALGDVAACALPIGLFLGWGCVLHVGAYVPRSPQHRHPGPRPRETRPALTPPTAPPPTSRPRPS